MDDTLKFVSTYMNVPLVAMVIARIGGLMSFAPFFSSAVIPVKARALLTLGVTLLVAPFVAGYVNIPEHLGLLVPAMISELMIGMIIGFCLMVVFAALELGGLLAGQQMGLAMARMFDPLFNEQGSVLGQFFFWLAMIIFLVIGGHRVLLSCVINSFESVPAGSFMVNADVMSVFADTLQVAFVVALKIAIPVILTIFLMTLALGFLMRTVPQLNILSVGFPLRAMMGFMFTVICLGAGMDIFIGVFDDVFQQLRLLLGL